MARRKLDPIEKAIESVVVPGVFIHDNKCWDFVDRLEEVRNSIDHLLLQGEAPRAVHLTETFIACVAEKAEEVDDSSGQLGMFVDNLVETWIRASQAAGADPGETASRLFEWMESEAYGMGPKLAQVIVKALDREGRKAFASAADGRFRRALEDLRSSGTDIMSRQGYRARSGAEVARTALAAAGDLKGYLAVCELTELKTMDCACVAEMLAARRKLDEALTWVERGLDLSRKSPFGGGAAYELEKLQEKLLKRLGREGDLVEEVWRRYRERPCGSKYASLLKHVPKAERGTWKEKALELVGKCRTEDALDILVKARDLDRLAALVGQKPHAAFEDASHYWTEPAARLLEKTHPGAGAKLHRAMAFRILNSGKSRYYGAALRNLKDARKCYERAGELAAWHEIVKAVRTTHRRKAGFVGDFEREVIEKGKPRPSFLERAMKRWGKMHGMS